MRAALKASMSIVGSHRDLEVWAVSMDLVDEVFQLTKRMPPREFDLRRQIIRAAVSIPANIAEGWSRKDRRQAYQNHVSIALGSRGELDTLLEVCYRNALLNRTDGAQLDALLGRARQMLLKLYAALG